jgi:serine/threonine protein kinase
MKSVLGGKYQLVRKLAAGGMADVYLGRQASIGGFEKDVVIKRMLPTLSKDVRYTKMFMREARLAARLNHTNIVQIFDVVVDDGIHFIAMEYVRGHDMFQVHRRSLEMGMPLLIGQAAKIASDVASGLECAHSATDSDGARLSIVHQDISPSNILLSSDGCVKIVDFGIAKAAITPSDTVTRGVIGKRGYIAPEQIRGEKVTGSTDLFSLGVLLYEWTTHRPLFARESVLLTEKATLEEKIIPPTTIIRDYPRALEKIVMRSLQRDPRKRYSRARQMHEDLEDFLMHSEHGCSMTDLANFHNRLFQRDETGSAGGTDGGKRPASTGESRPVSQPYLTPADLLRTPSIVPETKGISPYLGAGILVLVCVVSGLLWYAMLGGS